jgi:hypothetical protein
VFKVSTTSYIVYSEKIDPSVHTSRLGYACRDLLAFSFFGTYRIQVVDSRLNRTLFPVSTILTRATLSD